MSRETASTSQIYNKTGILKGEESKVGTGKVCEELMGKISKSDENQNPTQPSSMNSNTRNKKKTATRHVIIKTFKSNQQKKRHYVQRSKDKNEGRFTVRIKMSEKIGEHHL